MWPVRRLSLSRSLRTHRERSAYRIATSPALSLHALFLVRLARLGLPKLENPTFMATFAAWLPATRIKPASSHVRTSPTNFTLCRARAGLAARFFRHHRDESIIAEEPCLRDDDRTSCLAGPSWWHMSHQGSGFDSSWRVAAAAPPRGLPSPSTNKHFIWAPRATGRCAPPAPPDAHA